MHAHQQGAHARRGHERITFLLASRCSSIAPPPAAVWRCRLCVGTRNPSPDSRVVNIMPRRAGALALVALVALVALTGHAVESASLRRAAPLDVDADAMVEDPSQLTDEQLHLSHGSLTPDKLESMKTEMKSLKTTLDSLLTKQAVLSYQYKDALQVSLPFLVTNPRTQ